jgi:predicted kinase
MITSGIHICMMDSGVDTPTCHTDYLEFRRAIMKVGRFSVFEATTTQQSARMFDRLCKDPAVKTVDVGFPWTAVRWRRAKKVARA